MSSVNKVILVGNLGKDPEVRYTSGGKAVADFSIATSESFGKGSEREEQTEWHRVVVWDRLAELCGQHLRKGSKVYVEGKIQTRKWTDKQGAERFTTEIIAKQVVFLSPKGDSGRREPEPSGKGGKSKPAGTPHQTFDDDEIPF